MCVTRITVKGAHSFDNSPAWLCRNCLMNLLDGAWQSTRRILLLTLMMLPVWPL